MGRYIYILILITTSSCFAAGTSYSFNKLPIPQINYLKTPYEQIRDVNSPAHFDASTSYAPEGGRIIEWKWDFYKFNGKEWDFLFSLRGPDKAIINCNFGTIGWYRVRLWVRASDGRWNQDSDVKDCFVYAIYNKLFADRYVAAGAPMTFTYIIKLPKDIEVKEACLMVLDEYGLEFAEIWIKNPVIGKEGKIEWNSRANKGPNTGELMPAGHFTLNFRVVPFIANPLKTIDNENENNPLDTQEERIYPNY